MVPRVGIEPTLPKEPDFESGASTNSATPAYISGAIIYVCGFCFQYFYSFIFFSDRFWSKLIEWALKNAARISGVYTHK